MIDESLHRDDANKGQGPWLGDLFWVILLSAPFTFWGIGLTFLDPDEGLYGSIVREMLESKDWIVTRFNGLLYLEKPPLFFWLSGLTVSLAGLSEWPIRLWSVLPALGTIILVWLIGRLLYGRRAGIFAALAFTSSAGYVLYVWKASTDFLLVFSVTLAMYGLLRDVGAPNRTWTHFSLLYLGVALGLLSKGLIGAVFPVLIVATLLVWVRNFRIAELNLVRGLTLVALIVLPWHLWALWRDADLMWFYLVDNQLLRFLAIREILEDDVTMSTVGFWLVTLIWFFPWCLFLCARRNNLNAGPGQEWRALIPIWAIVVMFFFSLSRSKLEFYGLPALPALAVMVGGAWQSGRDIGSWLWIGTGAAILAGWALIKVGSGISPNAAMYLLAQLNAYYRILLDQGVSFPFPSPQPLGEIMRWMGVTLMAGWSGAAVLWSVRRRNASFGVMLMMCGVVGFLIMQIVKFVEPQHSVKGVATALNQRVKPGDVIVHEGSIEYSAALPFYTGRRIVILTESSNRPGARLDLLKSGVRDRGGEEWFVGPLEFDALWGGHRRVFLVTQWPRSVSAAARLPGASVREIGQFGSRRLYSNR